MEAFDVQHDAGDHQKNTQHEGYQAIGAEQGVQHKPQPEKDGDADPHQRWRPMRPSGDVNR